MSEEELIKETMRLDYSQLVMHNVYMIKENKRLHSIIKEIKEYIKQNIEDEYKCDGLLYKNEDKEKLLNILKGSDKE